MNTFLNFLCSLVAVHALCDYPLQGDFLSRAKNRLNPIPGVPWYQALGAHAIIHGAGVALVTGSLWLGLAEACFHSVIDDTKCAGRISFNHDQALHIGCKIIFAALVAVGI